MRLQPFEQLEQDWARWNDLDPAGMVVCSSGTSALHLACEALQLTPGSKVICPDLTMIACPRSITLAGLEPVFVDCGDDLLMDDGDPMGYATVDPYSAFMSVHIYGRRCDMDWISSTAGVCHPVIEDLAEAHGIRPHSTTDAACWSFYKNKIIAGEEGGAVWFRDNDHAKLARQLRSLGFTDDHDFTHIPRGHNYRMSNAHAELILSSLRGVDHNLRDRWTEMGRLDAACPAEWRMPERQAPWVYDMRIPGMTRVQHNAVVKALNDVGITARHCFKPCSRQPEYIYTTKMVANDNINGTKSSVASQEVIYLALTPGRPRIDGIVFGIILAALHANGYKG